MPCPVCNHTMQNLGLETDARRVFWCPRCGCVKTLTRQSAGLADWEDVTPAQWTRPDEGVSVRQRMLAMLWNLTISASHIDKAIAYFRDGHMEGEALEAVGQVERADAIPQRR